MAASFQASVSSAAPATNSGDATAEAAPYLTRLPQRGGLSPHEQSTAVKHVAAAPNDRGENEEDAAVAVPPTIEDGPPPVIDESAEAEFLAEARERGEVVRPVAAADLAEETSKKPLPPLNDLVAQIPSEVREVLEDLFRARFVSVKRFPKKALKS